MVHGVLGIEWLVPNLTVVTYFEQWFKRFGGPNFSHLFRGFRSKVTESGTDMGSGVLVPQASAIRDGARLLVSACQINYIKNWLNLLFCLSNSQTHALLEK